MELDTQLIHGGGPTDGQTGAVNVPVYQVSTFEQERPGEADGYAYSRINNPTREALEGLVADLEHGAGASAFGSGMAAISAALMLFESGDHLLVSQQVYGGTYRVLTEVFDRFDLSFTFVDPNDPEALSRAATSSTRGLYLETPTNPLLQITDLEAAAGWASERDILTLVDNTFLSPYFQNPIDLGVDLVIHSATKYLGGHSDVIAGLVVAADAELADGVASVQSAVGAVPGPWDCWLLLRGIKTLGVRMRAHEASAEVIASWLQDDPRIDDVYYPGLPDHPGHDIHRRQAGGDGGMVSFTAASEAVVDALTTQLRYFTLAPSLGGVESLLNVSAKMTHATMPEARRAKLGITDRVIRLSVGLESVDDLIADLEAALAEV